MSGGNCTAFVGNLAWSATDDDLASIFGQFGTVTSAEVQYNGTRSKGFALVSMSSPEELQDAISGLNDTEQLGRTIIVREDRGAPARTDRVRQTAPRERVRRERRERVVKPVSEQDPCRLFVGNLPWSVTEEGLESIFSSYGVTSVELLLTRTGRSLGRAIVSVSSPEEAQRAIAELHDTDCEGRLMVVKIDEL